MIGCFGRATSTSIQCNDQELEQARWIAPEQALHALQRSYDLAGFGKSRSLRFPPHTTIAHHLIRQHLETVGGYTRSDTSMVRMDDADPVD
jgi:NADH pyrophosphatase NudC (nudix superfamily)